MKYETLHTLLFKRSFLDETQTNITLKSLTIKTVEK